MFKHYGLLVAAFLFTCSFIYSQNATLNGRVTASENGEGLIGVTISLGSGIGTVSDENGNYSVTAEPGSYSVQYSYIGFLTHIESVKLETGNVYTLNVSLAKSSSELNLVVVTASKYEKKISEETVSMEVLKPSFISTSNCIKIDEAVEKVPGVNIIDGQANIRGGSGFSYGAGSRVLVLVDDIPQLTADANDVKWEFLPVENLEQVEIIKGASSVLYGSSALNGVINVRTAYPGSTPKTVINAFQGIWQNPQDTNKVWWGNHQPYFGGMNFFHSRKIGQFDLVLGGNAYNERSFREGEYTQRGRINANTRYRFKNIDGLSAGLNTNFMNYHSGTYFLWANDTTGALLPFGGLDSATTTISEGSNTRWNVDPFITYYSANGDRHSLKMRYFYTRNNNNTHQGSTAQLYYGEYQYQKQFNFGLSWIAGISGNYDNVVADLYGNHDADNYAAYTQLDKKFGKLSVVGGVRYELFRVDSVKGNSNPVFRVGLNYPITKSTFVRASFGQGYRFPSIAEKYVSTSVGTLKVFPNPDVQPEKGWSSEVGIKQGFKVSNWLGYLDLSVFYQSYSNLIQFTFGYYDPNPIPNIIDLNYLGFKSVNIENARIYGTEFSVIGQGAIGQVQTNLLAGITYIDPINLDQKNYVDSLVSSDDALTAGEKDSLYNTEILNYRFKVTAKFNLDMQYKKFSWGADAQYNSYMVNIDKFFEGTDPVILGIFGQPFEFIPGIREYRLAHNKGDVVLNARVAYNISNSIRVSFITKNLLNREYTVRPALIEDPRSFTVLFSMAM